MFPNMWGKLTETMDRMADTAALASAQNAGGRMYIEPEKVDEVANFFIQEAATLRGRAQDVFDLSQIDPPGTDDVSTQSADKYGQVAAGGANSYRDAYNDLANYLESTGNELRASAKQTRTNDQDSADSLRH